jgi:aminopeptidase N
MEVVMAQPSSPRTSPAWNWGLFTVPILFVLPAAVAAQPAPPPNPFAPPRAKVQYAPDRDYDLLHVALDLKVDYPRFAFQGVVVNTLAPLRDDLSRTGIRFHCGANLLVERCEVAGERARFTRDGGLLRIEPNGRLPRGKPVAVTVRYAGGEERTGFRWIRPTAKDPHRVGFYTDGAVDGHPHWIPTWNYPNDLATSETRVTVPADWYVVGNGELKSDALNPGGKTRTFHWTMDRPHATYLLSLAGGPFDIKTASWRDVPLTYTVPKGRGDLIDETFGETPDMLSFYSDLLGVKYPWPRYAQSVMHGYGGGMEWVTATMFGEWVLTERRMGVRARSPVVAHELAHQWFGNLVTCRDWGHLWLNEGFAIFFGQMLYTEHWRGRDAYAHAVESFSQNYFREGRRYKRPLATNLYERPDSMFDDHTYAKGGVTLHTLRRHLGDKVFLQGLRHYLTKYRHTAVDSHDLCVAMTEGTGINLERFFDQWVYKPGHPVLDYAWTWDEVKKQVVLTVKQVQDTKDGTPVYDLNATVGLISGGGVRREKAIINATEQQIRVGAASKPDAVLLDPDHDFLRELPTLRWSAAELPHILKYAPNAVDREEAMKRMLEGTPSDAAVKVVADAVGADKGRFPAFRSIARLGRLKRSDLRPLFREQMAHPNFDRREQAIRAAGGLPKDEEDMRTLRGLVNDQQPYAVVRAALSTLRDWDAPGNRDVFHKVAKMQASDVRIRLTAHDALVTADAAEGKEPSDPDPKTTERLRKALTDIASGAKESPLMTPGFRSQAIPGGTAQVAEWLKDLKSFTFLMRDEVEEERHGAKVSHICYYKMVTAQTTYYHAFYLTAGGELAGLRSYYRE